MWKHEIKTNRESARIRPSGERIGFASPHSHTYLARQSLARLRPPLRVSPPSTCSSLIGSVRANPVAAFKRRDEGHLGVVRGRNGDRSNTSGCDNKRKQQQDHEYRFFQNHMTTPHTIIRRILSRASILSLLTGKWENYFQKRTKGGSYCRALRYIFRVFLQKDDRLTVTGGSDPVFSGRETSGTKTAVSSARNPIP